ncbi:MAG: glycosyltransferase family 4 protein [Candidatus Lindowbacteria bacterium]|nr:glycosyltransferase family 4 protein [Candidatus Lindowbacteria bacterium]
MNAYSGLLLRRLGAAERVVYYVIDYAPQRFRNRLGQRVYRELDKRCCYGSDAVWNVSASMEEARREAGVNTNKCAPQLEVPLGSRYSEIQAFAHEGKNPNLMVFLGSLTQEQGLSLMIEAMPKVIHRTPGARLRIIGNGPEYNPLKTLANEKGLSDAIEFTGFVEDDTEAAKLVAEGAIGIAPYVSTAATYKRFADPGKVKIYLAAGLPVVITRVPQVAALIEAREAGVAIEPDANSLAETLSALLSSPERLHQSQRSSNGPKAKPVAFLRRP